MEPLKRPMRIAMLDVARAQRERLGALLDFPHEFAEPVAARQTVDAVIALRFGAAEAALYGTSLLHLPGAGADAVDMAVLEHGSVVCNVFEHEIPVAEFVMAAILDHTLGYGRMHTSFDGDRWNETYAARRPHGEVNGRILGLLGYGHIGKAVTQRAHAFGMQVQVISQSGNAPEADWVGRPAQLREMLPRVDFLAVACPLTDDTRGMLGGAELALMKRTASVINIGRAQIIEEESLFRALESRQLAGATLDVWYDYPREGAGDVKPSRFPFYRLPTVHCTAHSSGWSGELFQRRYAVIADNLARLHRSLPLRNVIYTAP
jgi:phosphoglycerate dehydrogenase-like enzyme